MNKLTAREKCFCRFCAALGNPAQAAEWAGIPADQAQSILGREEAAAFVAACEGELGRDSPEHQLLRGVLRLVREGGNDAAVLMLRHEELTPRQIQMLDLYGVSSFKRGSDGSVEIKLYDRLRALEMLERIVGNASDRQEADALCAALEQSAGTLCTGDGDGQV